MTTQTKDKLITISASVIGSVLLMFLGLFSTGMVDSRKEMQQEIKSKLDKEIYEQHCRDNKEAFDKAQENQSKYIESNNLLLQELVKQNAEIRTDINWIKRNIK
jgi:predicted nucleotidyltransferase